jgi:hypothetical protein
MKMLENSNDALKIAKDEEKMLLYVNIEKNKRGKYTLLIKVSSYYNNPFDKLTREIFVRDSNTDDEENSYSLREVIESKNNAFYEEIEIGLTDKYIKEFDNYEEAFEKLMSILETIEKEREKVRKAERKFETWVVI